jgi:hypothetical protein
MLLLIYFALGFIACIGIIVIEATSHQLTIELGNNYPTWIIYVCMSFAAFTSAGFSFVCYLGFYHLKKSLKGKH